MEITEQTPLTQEGKPAPADWKEHVTPVTKGGKPVTQQAQPAPKSTLSTTNPLEKDSSVKRTPLAIQYSPSGSSAQCYDGTYSTSYGSGTCSGHGGIYSYLTSV